MTTLPGSPPAGGPELGVDTMDLLRFATIGSVDDGKSTLIGRLLFDTRQLFDDQLTAIETASERRGLGEVDLSFVTDGLRAEREQGITIDVAYRYAATPHRKFVIADCPGHIQYTRNMATGASTADLALVLVDATSGLREQSRRHICIAALLGVDQLVVCANKMDLVDWDRSAYQRIADEMEALAHRLGISSCTVIPISALHGDNVVARSDAAPWYDGPTVLDALESAQAGGWAAQHGVEHGAAEPGCPCSGCSASPEAGATTPAWSTGEPSGSVTPSWCSPRAPARRSGPSKRRTGRSNGPRWGSRSRCDSPTISTCRGATSSPRPRTPRRSLTRSRRPCAGSGTVRSRSGDRLRIKHTTRVTPVVVESVNGIFDVNELRVVDATELRENDIGVVTLRTATPLAVDPYEADRITGSFVLIDDLTFATIAAGMVGPPRLHD